MGQNLHLAAQSYAKLQLRNLLLKYRRGKKNHPREERTVSGTMIKSHWPDIQEVCQIGTGYASLAMVSVMQKVILV